MPVEALEVLLENVLLSSSMCKSLLLAKRIAMALLWPLVDKVSDYVYVCAGSQN